MSSRSYWPDGLYKYSIMALVTSIFIACFVAIMSLHTSFKDLPVVNYYITTDWSGI